VFDGQPRDADLIDDLERRLVRRTQADYVDGVPGTHRPACLPLDPRLPYRVVGVHDHADVQWKATVWFRVAIHQVPLSLR
jgi:hypothetical protein